MTEDEKLDRDVDRLIFSVESDACKTLHLWNKNILPLMRERGDYYKRIAHAEAKRRKYRYNPDTEKYEET